MGEVDEGHLDIGQLQRLDVVTRQGNDYDVRSEFYGPNDQPAPLPLESNEAAVLHYAGRAPRLVGPALDSRWDCYAPVEDGTQAAAPLRELNPDIAHQKALYVDVVQTALAMLVRKRREVSALRAPVAEEPEAAGADLEKPAAGQLGTDQKIVEKLLADQELLLSVIRFRAAQAEADYSRGVDLSTQARNFDALFLLRRLSPI